MHLAVNIFGELVGWRLTAIWSTVSLLGNSNIKALRQSLKPAINNQLTN